MYFKLISTIILLLSVVTDAYFYIPEAMMSFPFKSGMATATRNDDTLIMFGGENGTSRYANELYQLSQVSDTFTLNTIHQNNPPPGSAFGQAVITNNNSDMYLLGGLFNATTYKEPLKNYRFSFSTNTWTPSLLNNESISNVTALPLNRLLFSATYDNQNKIYIYGGASTNYSLVFGDFYSLDLTTQQYTEINGPGVIRYGHTASLLSNGDLVLIGGFEMISRVLNAASMNVTYVFDTRSSNWRIEKTVAASGSVIPSSRGHHSAVITSDDRIIIIGGNNGANIKNNKQFDTLSILNTKDWTWDSPVITGKTPSKRSQASVGLLRGNYLTVAFGTSQIAYYNDVNVFDISTATWLRSFTPDSEEHGLSTGAIAGIAVAYIASLLIVIFLLWKFKVYVVRFFKRVHSNIWKPRTGEPIWAETTRIAFQVFLFFIFVVFLTFVVQQAIESPNVIQVIEEPSPIVDVPDIRFCFEGYPQYPIDDYRNLNVTCTADNGHSCTQFIHELDMSVFQPVYSTSLGEVHCFMFRAPSEFVLTSISATRDSNSLLTFQMWGDQSIDYGRIHISTYPKQMDPNTAVYGINDSIPTLLSPYHVNDFISKERNDMAATNVFDIDRFTISVLAYNLIDRQILQDVRWNYMGFSPITNSTPEIETHFSQQSPTPFYANRNFDIGVVQVFPSKFITTIKREVRMYTLVNALGFVGGIFSILFAVQTWLFGFRPRSPWGVFQRWSFGSMKRSLLRGLQSKFKMTDSGVPLVHPVHHRFSDTDSDNIDNGESEIQRVNRVEERVQMLEMLFKAYYVNDEVFRSLSDANESAKQSLLVDDEHIHHFNNDVDGNRFPSTNSSTVPKTEKIIDIIND